MTFYYQYSIIGLKILCQTPFPVKIQEEAREFLFPVWKDEIKKGLADADMRVVFSPAASLPVIPDDALCRAEKVYSRAGEEEQIYHLRGGDRSYYACTVWQRDEQGRPLIECRYLTGSESRISYSKGLAEHIGMETLFLHSGGLMIHSSLIRWRNRAVLFTAPSGTGKSTQADLWVRYEQADILNGDRAVVRKTENGWYAYGLPYAGSSGIYRNEHATLGAVIVLRQAEENRIRKISYLEVVQSVYPELTVHRWDHEAVERALTLLMELAEDIPFYLLECRPDKDAVDAVKNVLIGGQNGC